MEIKWFNINDLKNMKKQYELSYDKYTEYIDNYSQMIEAEQKNRRINKCISFCNKVISQMEEISQKLNTNVEYCKGNFRIKHNGKYYYKKLS